MYQKLTSFIEKHFYKILFLLLLWFLAKESYGTALEFYFWRDDWALLWSANYNPDDFFHTTVGPLWYVRAGVLWYPYVIYLHKFIQDTGIWQYFGLILKFVNSVLFYFFVFALTKNKFTSIVGAFLYASYSGGIESYTWHRITGLVTTFILLGFTYYARFLDQLESVSTKAQSFAGKYKYLFFSIIAIFLAFLSYVGRAAGIIPAFFLFNILLLLRKDISKNIKSWIVKLSIAAGIVFLFIIVFAIRQQQSSSGYLLESMKNGNLFFGITGNLLRNPFLKIAELGSLSSLDNISYILGFSVFFIGLIASIFFLLKKTPWLSWIVFSISWVYFFYFTNWFLGGGGIYTIIGSGHRYFTLAAVGWVLFATFVISVLNKKLAIIATIILIAYNLNYSKYIVDADNSVRNTSIVKPIYATLYEKMKNGENAELIVIHTPNYLASFVVGGWYPYTYAYMRELSQVTQFPVVISRWESALEWVCANKESKKEIQARSGFADNQNLEKLDSERIYAFFLKENGELSDKTDALREYYSQCNSNLAK